MITDELIKAAAKLSSAGLHEASGRCGALPARLKPLTVSMRLCGRALPVRCPAGDNLWIHRALDQAKPSDAIIVECGEGVEYGYWGEIMATAAAARKVAGLVITGGVRDSAELITLGLPTFSACVSIRGAGKNPDLNGAVGDPVRIGEIVVRQGDLVFGDADGVCVLSPEAASTAVPAAIDRDEAEKEILEKIRAGASTTEVYKL